MDNIDNIRGKKILILGGNSLIKDIVIAAKQMGVYTIVTDWNSPKESPAKLIADEYWMDSLSDLETLANKIQQHKISGIITGFTDSYLPYYIQLCQKTNLPCYVTNKQLIYTLDKQQFKQLCINHNIPIVPQYDINSFDETSINENSKIIIKPIDNSGSRGICICQNKQEFQSKLQYSLSFSKKHHVIIEEYMDTDDVSFEYKIQDGEITLSAICDRYIYKTEEFGSVTKQLIYPSKHTELYLKDVNDRVIDTFKSLGLKNGVLFMQAFFKNNNFYFYEMGYRLSGGRHYIFTENQNNSSAIKELIYFSLTGKMAEYSLKDRNTPFFRQICSQISILCNSATISEVKGYDAVKSIPQVIDFTPYYKEGDTVGAAGTTAQIAIRIHIVANNEDELQKIVEQIYETIAIYDKDGNDLVIRS